MMGAYIVLFPKGKIRTIIFLGFFGQVLLVPAWVMIGLWFLLQLFSGFSTLGGSIRVELPSGRTSGASSPVRS